MCVTDELALVLLALFESIFGEGKAFERIFSGM